jgi:hypothetical protein
MFRISGTGDFLVDVEDVEQIEPMFRNAEPGRYHVDEMSTRLLPSGHTARTEADLAATIPQAATTTSRTRPRASGAPSC